MRATLRSTATLTFEATAASIADARAKIADEIPAGFELIDAQPVMAKGTSDVTVKAVARSTETSEMEAGDLAQLRERTPDGWQLQAVLNP